jgi:protein-L-isoaspartate(D-aspartate) O-methyltransferase
MTELAIPRPTDRVLEIGTGSGYQAAILSMLAKTVFSMEIIPELAERAGATLKRLGYDNVKVRNANGYAGWPEEAPFDVILVTAAPEEIPQTLVDQLAPSGRMVMPVGPEWRDQTLILIEKDEKGEVHYRNVATVSFVPMVDRPQWGGTSGNRDKVE